MRILASVTRDLLLVTREGMRGGKYNLADCWLDAETAVLRVTDGHTAIVLPVEVQDDTSGPIPRGALRYLLNGNRRTLRAEPDRVVVTTRLGRTITFSRLKTKYPRFDSRVFPPVSGPPTVSLNARLLLRLARALGGDGLVDLWITDNKTAIHVALERGTDMRCAGVIMPCKSSTTDIPLLAQQVSLTPREEPAVETSANEAEKEAQA